MWLFIVLKKKRSYFSFTTLYLTFHRGLNDYQPPEPYWFRLFITPDGGSYKWNTPSRPDGITELFVTPTAEKAIIAPKPHRRRRRPSAPPVRLCGNEGVCRNNCTLIWMKADIATSRSALIGPNPTRINASAEAKRCWDETAVHQHEETETLKVNSGILKGRLARFSKKTSFLKANPIKGRPQEMCQCLFLHLNTESFWFSAIGSYWSAIIL